MPRMFLIRHATLFNVVMILALGCQKKGLPSPDAVSPAPPVVHTGPPLTDDDYQEFGRKLENAIGTGDKAGADRLLCLKELFERCLIDLPHSSAEDRGLMKRAANNDPKLADQIIHAIKGGGKYSLLRVLTVDGRKRVLFRWISADGAVSYHEVTLARYQDGHIGAEDIYMFEIGEMLSQSIRRLLMLPETEKVYLTHFPAIREMTQDHHEGRNQHALATFRKLPPELQKARAFQLIAIQAARAIDDSEFQAEIERFQLNHSGDPALDLLSIELFRLKKQYDESLQAISRLDQMIGGDPYLNVLRGKILIEADRYPEARSATEQGIHEDPNLEELYWARIDVAFKEKNHADALLWIKKLTEALDLVFDPEELKKISTWAEFIKTPQFAELTAWLAKRAEK